MNTLFRHDPKTGLLLITGFFQKHRKKLADISHNAVIAFLENGGVRVGIDTDNDFRVPHAGHMLRLPRNAQGKVKPRGDAVVGDPNDTVFFKLKQLFGHRKGTAYLRADARRKFLNHFQLRFGRDAVTDAHHTFGAF